MKIDGLLVYHAKIGGDLDGPMFKGDKVFFADHPRVAATYAEHVFYNKSEARYASETEYCEDFLASSPVVFPVRLTIERPVVLSRRLLRAIGSEWEFGSTREKLGCFADRFEDSNQDERNAVFSWAKQHGYDGAVLPKDLMPIIAGGDSGFKKSYVSFYPKRQVRFAICHQCEQDLASDAKDVFRPRNLIPDQKLT